MFITSQQSVLPMNLFKEKLDVNLICTPYVGTANLRANILAKGLAEEQCGLN